MKYFRVKGVSHSLSRWAELAGISRQAMAKRVAQAESQEELEMALTEPDFQGKAARIVLKERFLANKALKEAQKDLFEGLDPIKSASQKPHQLDTKPAETSEI